MNVGIDGVEVHPLREIADERGAVLHMLRSDAVHYRGFGEVYFSEVRPGAVKAWKFHRIMTQHFAVPCGRIRLVIYDDRADSATRGAVAELELGRPDAYRLVIVPPQLWYGFTALGAEPALLANCADVAHTTGESDRLDPNEATVRIPYAW